jgi:hypothetical protein
LAKIGPRTRRDVLLYDLRPRDVRGHEVGRELDATELQAQRPGEARDQQRLRQPRDPDQQRVTSGQDGDQQSLDDLLLADDLLGDLVLDPPPRFRQALEQLDVPAGKWVGSG